MNSHAYATTHVANRAANFFIYADSFVSQNSAGLHSRKRAANHVQVCAANGARSQLNNGIVWFLYFGFFDIIKADIAYPMKNNSFHDPLLLFDYEFVMRELSTAWSFNLKEANYS